MARVEKTVFISYRRINESWALAIVQNLTQHGFDVFVDYLGIASGDFERVISENIKARAHFLVVLTPSALQRCREPGDWLRREIEMALETQRNIIPIVFEGFNFSSPAISSQLTGKLEALKRYNALSVPTGYFNEAMERLREKYLNISLEMVLHPASKSAQEIAASYARAVQEHQLSSGDTEASYGLTVQQQANINRLLDPTSPDHEVLSPTELQWLAKISDPEQRRNQRSSMVFQKALLLKQTLSNLNRMRRDAIEAVEASRRNRRQPPS